MSKTILLPLDGSALADRARPYAVALARRTSGKVVLMEAVALKTRPHEPTSNADIQVMDKADKYLADVAAEMTADGIHTEYHELFDDPAQAILDAIERYEVDLVVMATHGRSGVGRMIYGSVADEVLRHSLVPVLLVPAHSQRAWSAERPLRVLVPLDGSPLAEEALTSAQLLAEAFGAHIDLLRVVEPPAYPLYGDGYAYIPYDEESDLADARAYVEDRAQKLRALGLDISTSVLVGTAGRTIEALARDQGADVIAMATHGLGGLGRLVLGSVATDVLRRGIAPVLLIRPSEVAQEEPAAPAAVASQPAAPASPVTIQPSDLPLVLRGLRAVAYLPGADNEDVAAATKLADSLEQQASTPGVQAAAR